MGGGHYRVGNNIIFIYFQVKRIQSKASISLASPHHTCNFIGHQIVAKFGFTVSLAFSHIGPSSIFPLILHSFLPCLTILKNKKKVSPTLVPAWPAGAGAAHILCITQKKTNYKNLSLFMFAMLEVWQSVVNVTRHHSAQCDTTSADP